MDAWIQGSLWSNVDLYFNMNLLNMETLNVKFSLAPFKIIPLWASLYYTHPAAVYQGTVDEFAAAIDFGYELHTGETSVSYYLNSLVPKVSLLDVAISGSTTYLPATPGDATANAAGINGWDWNVDANNAWVAEPYFSFDLLQWLIDEGKVDLSQYNLSNYASFFDAPIKLFGDANIGAAQ